MITFDPDITGSIKIADMFILFSCDSGNNKASYTISKEGCTFAESRSVPSDGFLKALAIAIHNDGMPDYNKDYPDAESVQPNNPELRFIP